MNHSQERGSQKLHERDTKRFAHRGERIRGKVYASKRESPINFTRKKSPALQEMGKEGREEMRTAVEREKGFTSINDQGRRSTRSAEP